MSKEVLVAERIAIESGMRATPALLAARAELIRRLRERLPAQGHVRHGQF
jgi:hypothetical protein